MALDEMPAVSMVRLLADESAYGRPVLAWHIVKLTGCEFSFSKSMKSPIAQQRRPNWPVLRACR